MVRFDFNIKRVQVFDIYDALEEVEQKHELRYGVFHQGTAFAEIITSDEGQNEIEAVLSKLGIKYGLERVL